MTQDINTGCVYSQIEGRAMLRIIEPMCITISLEFLFL